MAPTAFNPHLIRAPNGTCVRSEAKFLWWCSLRSFGGSAIWRILAEQPNSRPAEILRVTSLASQDDDIDDDIGTSDESTFQVSFPKVFTLYFI